MTFVKTDERCLKLQRMPGLAIESCTKTTEKNGAQSKYTSAGTDDPANIGDRPYQYQYSQPNAYLSQAGIMPGCDNPHNILSHQPTNRYCSQRPCRDQPDGDDNRQRYKDNKCNQDN